MHLYTNLAPSFCFERSLGIIYNLKIFIFALMRLKSLSDNDLSPTQNIFIQKLFDELYLIVLFEQEKQAAIIIFI